MWWRIVLEFLAACAMLGGFGVILFGLHKGSIAFSARTIQFLALTLILPGTIILSLEHTLGNEGTTAIFGTVVGYALAFIGKSE